MKRSGIAALAATCALVAGCGIDCGNGTIEPPTAPCEAQPCQSPATCVEVAGAATCRCPAGHENDPGNAMACRDVDECALAAHDCDANAACSNTEGGFACACNTGFVGDGTTCSNIDECAAGTDDCDSHANCADSEGSFVCTCQSGFAGDGTTCDNIDECSAGTDNCDDDATCTDNDGGFNCACNDGFAGDGVTCLRDCASDPALCDPHATCTDVNGDRLCVCNAGYTGDGALCTDVDGCAANPCFSGVTCIDEPAPGTGFSCGPCPTGFQGDGIACSDVDGCAGNPCFAGVICHDVVAPGVGYTCGACPVGYHGTGETCDDDDECLGEGSGHDCAWPRICANSVGSFGCVCGPVDNPGLSDPGDRCGAGSPDVATSWTTTAGAVYTVEFFDGASWGTVDQQHAASATQLHLAVGTDYRFRISTVVDSCPASGFSETGPFAVVAPPQAPTTLASADVCAGDTPQISFSGEVAATGQDVLVVGPDSVSYDFFAASSPLDLVGLDGALGLYGWSVTTHGNALCPDATSDSQTFELLPLPVLPTALASPSGCAATTVGLDWSSGQVFGSYEVQLDYGAGWVATGVSAITSSSAQLLTSSVGTFPWRVTHRTPTCGSEVAAASSVQIFPPPVRPTSPVASEACAGILDSTLGWGSGQAAGSYLVEIDYGSGWVTTGIGGVSQSGATLSTANSGTFPWRVQHLSSNCGPSAVATGSVVVTPPPAPNPIPPANLVTPAGGVEPYAANLGWTHTTPVPASGYRVELMTGSCGGTSVAGWPRTTSSNAVATGWLNAGTYHWRVTPLAHRVCPIGTASACQSFVVNPLPVAWHGRDNSEYGLWTDRIAGSASGGGFTASAASENGVQLVLDASDRPVVAWSAGSQIFLLRWTGAAWEELAGSGRGGGVSNCATGCSSPALALDSAGRPALAWQDTAFEIFFRRWDGAAWQELGGSGAGTGVSNNATYSLQPSLALDSNDDPVLAWSDGSSSTAGRNIYLRRWDGTNWIELASSGSGVGLSNCGVACRHPSLAIDGSDNPTVAWLSWNFSYGRGVFVRRWSGTSWDELAGSASGPGGLCDFCDGTSDYADQPSLRIDSADHPIVTWSAYDTGGVTSYRVYLKKFDGTSWTELAGSASAGINTRAGYARYPSLVLGASDRPMVAWAWSYSGAGWGPFYGIMLRAWSGSAWQEIGGSETGGGISNNVGASNAPTLALDSGGLPAVAWLDGISENYNSEGFLRRFDGATWNEIYVAHSGGGISDTATASRAPTLAASANGALFVAWEEQIEQDAYIYLRSFDGAGWQQLANSGSGYGLRDYIFPARQPSIAVDPTTGYPVVAWGQDTLDDEIYLRRWNGTAWVGLGGSDTGGGISNSLNATDDPSLAIFSNGYPIVAWSNFPDREIYARQWNGSSWVGANSGGGVSNTVGTNSRNPSVAVDASSRALLAWQDQPSGYAFEIYFKRGSGGSWSALGTSASGGGISNSAGSSIDPAVVADGSGNPVVAWTDDTPGNSEIYLKTYNGSSWVELAGSATAGGISASAGSSGKPSLAIDSRGRLVVAWQDDSAGDSEIYLRRLEGTAWVELDGSASGVGISNSDAGSYHPSVFAAAGRICVAWEEASATSLDIVLRCHVE